MSAIAALCAVSCTVASMDLPVEQMVVRQEVAQLPVNGTSRKIGIRPTIAKSESSVSLPKAKIEDQLLPLEPGEISQPFTVNRLAISGDRPTDIQPKSTIATLQDNAVRSMALPVDSRRAGQEIAQIPINVESQTTPVNGESQAIPINVDPQEMIELGGDGNFTDVQVTDRQGDQQVFPLEESEEETPEASASSEEPVLNVLEVIGDRQEYDEPGQIVTARGNVVARFQDSVLTADQIDINLNSKLAIATGNVTLRRGQQLLRGERFDYFFVQNRGFIQQASGEVSLKALSSDPTQPAQPYSNITDPAILLNERLLLSQPITNVNATNDGVNFTIGSTRDSIDSEIGSINRVRFYAAEVEFFGDRWEAQDVRLTNDPFNPPELQILASSATYQPIDEFTDELVTRDTRLSIDDNISIPVYPRTFRFDKSDEDNGIFSLVSFGYDGDERGGLYVQRRITIFNDAKGRWTVTPQYLIQKALIADSSLGQADDNADTPFSPAAFALKTDFNYNFNPRFFVVAKGSVPSLNLDNVEDRLRFNLIVEQQFGKLNNPFRLSQEFNYRDRLFNGSLGFQRVKSSLGIVLRSPLYRFGNSGVSLDYQASLQNITADTDRAELLDPGIGFGEVNLTRYQGTVGLNYGLPLWQGQALPATREQGLRYSPRVIVPYVSLFTGLRGVASLYSSGDRQLSASANIGIQGQFGHFARKSFNYTGFNISYGQSAINEVSPFLFDRIADSRTLSFGLTQQLYGPFRIGFQTSRNIETKQAISTDYFIEYSRRTHSVLLRYNPVLQLGSINFKINDFNWNGTTDPFVTGEVRPVVDGVIP